VLKNTVLVFFKRFARNEFEAKRPKHAGREAKCFAATSLWRLEACFFNTLPGKRKQPFVVVAG